MKTYYFQSQEGYEYAGNFSSLEEAQSVYSLEDGFYFTGAN